MPLHAAIKYDIIVGRNGGYNMKIIAGLGNPGIRYEFTRHNSGFLTLDYIADELNTVFDKKEHQALVATANYRGEKLLLLKPQAYMNLSGFPVVATCHYYKVDYEDLLVVFDDMDLPVGELRVRRDGSSGGHKGIASIIEQAGTNKINRIKIGIGHPFYGDGADYVLGLFADLELPIVKEKLKQAAAASLLWAVEGIEMAMREYNVKTIDS
jgi:PTH1 family peptidyl-tRNA hydrolase